MKYDNQCEILDFLAMELARELGGIGLIAIMNELEQRWGALPDRPESFAGFLEGAQRRGWITISYEQGAALVRGTGQLWMFVRRKWANVPTLAHLRVAISELVDTIVQMPSDKLLVMDEIAPSVAGPEREMAWDALLAAAPGLATQLSAPRDPKVATSRQIRFAQTMMDPVMLMRFVDISRDKPLAAALPIEVSR